MALTDGLESYWPLNEASGNAIDVHGSNDLTETSGTIAAATGKISGARDFEAGDSENFRAASSASLTTGDIDFTVSAWVMLESTGDNREIVCKFNAGGDSASEFKLDYGSAADRFRFVVRVASGGSNGTVTDTVLGAPSLATWYFLVAWHDAGANTLNLQINNGTVDSVSHTTGVRTGTVDWVIGDVSASGDPWDGLLCEIGFWKRVLTSDERTALWNDGDGLAYEDFDGGAAAFIPYPRPRGLEGGLYSMRGGMQ